VADDDADGGAGERRQSEQTRDPKESRMTAYGIYPRQQDEG
jgi:hypothetical protein